eukprot:scaffold39009_cov247-Isochrysis_galbana.AAC.1
MSVHASQAKKTSRVTDGVPTKALMARHTRRAPPRSLRGCADYRRSRCLPLREAWPVQPKASQYAAFASPAPAQKVERPSAARAAGSASSTTSPSRPPSVSTQSPPPATQSPPPVWAAGMHFALSTSPPPAPAQGAPSLLMPPPVAAAAGAC